MIATLRLHTDRQAALELLLRFAAAAVAGVTILGLLPAIAGAAG